MMLARIHRIHRPLICVTRSYTTPAYENFRKLRGWFTLFIDRKEVRLDDFSLYVAFPFEMSPEYAQRQMAKWAAVICDGINGSAVFSALATFLPFVEYKHPTRFSAAYFPAWILNAEIEADVTVRGSEVLHLALLFAVLLTLALP